MIYLDSAATTAISSEVLEEMLPFLKEQYGNPGSVHSLGRAAARAVAKAREQVANLIGASPNQIVFTSSGSEANNLAIIGSMKKLSQSGQSTILSDLSEHDSVLNSVQNFNYVLIKTGSFGAVSPDRIAAELKKNKSIGLVSVMYCNNETGAVNPVREIGKVCDEYGVIFHTDCVQAAGILPINVKKIGCDFLSLSGHKIHAPKGIGALYVKNKSLSEPIIYGGISQEHGLRGGTENVAGIVGFGKACEIAAKNRRENLKTVNSLAKRFYSQLLSELSKREIQNIVHINGSQNEEDFSKVLNLRFDGIDAETLVLTLDANGVCVSAGSACTSHEQDPSHVLLAMGLTSAEARNSVRFSFSETNTAAEMDKAAKITADCIDILRQS